MKPELQIDATLRVLGTAQPPAGLEGRIHTRLRAPRRTFRMIHSISIAAIAASVAVAAVALSPGLRDSVLQDLHLHHRLASPALPVIAHPVSGFGAASAVHVPAAPMPVQPTPVTQGRGHGRSRRTVLRNGTHAPLPRGVAVPAQAHISSSESSPKPASSTQP
jgi:hypothetical protein